MFPVASCTGSVHPSLPSQRTIDAQKVVDGGGAYILSREVLRIDGNRFVDEVAINDDSRTGSNVYPVYMMRLPRDIPSDVLHMTCTMLLWDEAFE